MKDLKAKRTRADLSQERLASMVGVSRAFISKIESSKATPSAELEDKLNRAVQEVINKKVALPDSLTKNKILFAQSHSASPINKPSLPNALNAFHVPSDGNSWMDVLSWAWKWFVRMELSFFQELDSPLAQMDFTKEGDEPRCGVKITGSISDMYLELVLSSPDINDRTASDIKWVIHRWFAKPDVVFRTESGAGETFSWVWFSPDASWTEKVKLVQSEAAQQQVVDMEESLKGAWDRFVAFHRDRPTVDPSK